MCEKTTGSLEANCFSQKYMYVYMEIFDEFSIMKIFSHQLIEGLTIYIDVN